MAKLVINYVKDKGSYLRDAEIEPALRALIEWLKNPDRTEDYHPSYEFGELYTKNLNNLVDCWKNYTLSDEWKINVSQETIMLGARALLAEGVFGHVELEVQIDGEKLLMDNRGELFGCAASSKHPKYNINFSRRLLQVWCEKSKDDKAD